MTWGGREQSHQEQRRAFEAQHAEDAKAQLEWEARAREEVAAWRERQLAEAAAEIAAERDEGDSPPG